MNKYDLLEIDLLRCPKLASGLERRQVLTAAPTNTRFIVRRTRSCVSPGPSHWFVTDKSPWVRSSFQIKKEAVSEDTALFLVGVAGLEPTASWSRTKRDTKLRHTPIAVVL